jgi:hypothetical protein
MSTKLPAVNQAENNSVDSNVFKLGGSYQSSAPVKIVKNFGELFDEVQQQFMAVYGKRHSHK